MNKQDNQIKFLLTENQANFYKFMLLLRRYFLRNLNTNEYLNFTENITIINPLLDIERDIIKILTDHVLINNFMLLWETNFIYYHKIDTRTESAKRDKTRYKKYKQGAN